MSEPTPFDETISKLRDMIDSQQFTIDGLGSKLECAKSVAEGLRKGLYAVQDERDRYTDKLTKQVNAQMERALKEIHVE